MSYYILLIYVIFLSLFNVFPPQQALQSQLIRDPFFIIMQM